MDSATHDRVCTAVRSEVWEQESCWHRLTPASSFSATSSFELTLTLTLTPTLFFKQNLKIHYPISLLSSEQKKKNKVTRWDCIPSLSSRWEITAFVSPWDVPPFLVFPEPSLLAAFTQAHPADRYSSAGYILWDKLTSPQWRKWNQNKLSVVLAGDI